MERIRAEIVAAEPPQRSEIWFDRWPEPVAVVGTAGDSGSVL
jgi:hypothetical protein